MPPDVQSMSGGKTLCSNMHVLDVLLIGLLFILVMAVLLAKSCKH